MLGIVIPKLLKPLSKILNVAGWATIKNTNAAYTEFLTIISDHWFCNDPVENPSLFSSSGLSSGDLLLLTDSPSASAGSGSGAAGLGSGAAGSGTGEAG